MLPFGHDHVTAAEYTDLGSAGQRLLNGVLTFYVALSIDLLRSIQEPCVQNSV